MEFTCQICQNRFSTPSNLRKHERTIHAITHLNKYVCLICNRSFKYSKSLQNHSDKEHNMENLLCDICGDSLNNRNELIKHNRECHTQGVGGQGSSKKKQKTQDIEKLCDKCGVVYKSSSLSAHTKSLVHKDAILKNKNQSDLFIIESAFSNRIISYRLINNENCLFFKNFIEEKKDKIISLINETIRAYQLISFNLEAFGMYFKMQTDTSDVITDTKSFNTKFVSASITSNLDSIIDEQIDLIEAKSSEMQERDSNWTLVKVLYLEINMNKVDPLRASSYIKLPKSLSNKKAVINIKNYNDEACFAWAITSYFREPFRNKDLVSSYPHYSSIGVNFQSVTFPTQIKQIPQFEEDNKNISINVYGIEETEKEIYVHIIKGTKKKKRQHHINLLFITDGTQSHFCLIKNLSRLVSSQLSKHRGSKYICVICFAYFSKKAQLEEHEQIGCNHIFNTLPEGENAILQFKNFQHSLIVPFVIYGDFECLLKPFDYQVPSDNQSFTVDIQMHEAFSFAYHIKCAYSTSDEYNKFVLYRGENPSETFISRIKEDVRWIISKFHEDKYPMEPLTVEQQRAFDEATLCELCNLEFTPDNVKCRDHNPLTGIFRCVSHMKCNLNYKIPNFIPIFFHNLSYDQPQIIQKLGLAEEKIKVIPVNKESYISFSLFIKVEGHPREVELRFLDSYRFLPSSLDNLAKNLSNEQLEILNQKFPTHFDLVKEKGIFCYDYLDSWERLKETSLPAQEKFYNSLTEKPCEDKDYKRAQDVWRAFNIQNLGEYSDLYLTIDTYLLMCIFENFRKVSMNAYKLDPAYYFTTPGLSWDAMLKYTEIKLELFQDINMLNYVRRGLRGGVSTCVKRYSKANNKYLEDYDPTVATSFIYYVDCNNLYGKAMVDLLPYGEFRWVEQSELENFDIMSVPEGGEKGYILEVDLCYPSHLHSLHRDFPFAAENMIPPGGKFKKLIASVMDKKNYVIYYRNLQQCVQHGLKVEKIHRALEFKQSKWLEKYVLLNTKMRTEAKDEFSRDLFKLFVNSCFGKFMEDLFKRRKVNIVTQWGNRGRHKGARDLISSPNFMSRVVINPDLVVIESKVTKLLLNKPIYLGLAILELSKHYMLYYFHDVLVPKYGKDMSLLYTDTDSLILELRIADLYKDIREDAERGKNSLLDTSNYSFDNRFGIPQINKKVVGCFKNECGDLVATTYIGVRAKSYCLLNEKDSPKKLEGIRKLKGITKSTVKNTITAEDFEKCLTLCNVTRRTMRVFRCIKQNIFTQLKRKIALSPGDDKRVICKDKINTLPWGSIELKTDDNSI